MWRSIPILAGAHASMHSGDQLISCGLTLSGELTKGHRSERQGVIEATFFPTLGLSQRLLAS